MLQYLPTLSWNCTALHVEEETSTNREQTVVKLGAGQTLAMLSQLRSERLVTHPFCSRETSGARVINGRNWRLSLSLNCQIRWKPDLYFLFFSRIHVDEHLQLVLVRIPHVSIHFCIFHLFVTLLIECMRRECTGNGN